MSVPLRQTGPVWLPKVAGVLGGLVILGGLVSLATSTTTQQPAIPVASTSQPAPSSTLPTVDRQPDPAPTSAEPEPTKAPTLGQSEALEAAESYVNSGHFSKAGLMEQLTSEYGEGFAEKDAAWALDHLEVDYNEEAAQAAKSYLDSGHFSKASLMDQLTSEYGEQFTKKQAAYGVKAAGL